MKITYILPAIGKKQGQPYIKTWQRMEPLTFSTLKALTPVDVETEFFDDRIELIDYETKTNLVAITTEVYTAKRAYQIAARFRARGIPVILGGFHTTLNPAEAEKYSDSILVGNAENIWEQVLDDVKNNRLKKCYVGTTGFKDILPDRSIFAGKNYSTMGVIETGRGCIHSCEFCAITSYYDATYHSKPVEWVVEDIKAAKKAGKKLFFFADDNIIADQDYAIELFKAISPLRIRWSGQGTLIMARNEELLKWMKRSGCIMVLIGYESLEDENLKQMNKVWNSKLGERDELTQKIHDAGLSIYATFVFGFDHDTPELFQKTVDFALKHNFCFAAFNHLLIMPGTQLHHRMLEEGRLVNEKWWLDSKYLYGDVIFKPAIFTAEELEDECRSARKRFYALTSIVKRSLHIWKRTKDPLLYLYFWYLNIKLRKEVDGKIGLPLGQNLDELPK